MYLAPAATATGLRRPLRFAFRVFIWSLAAFPNWTPVILYYYLINLISLPIFLPLVFIYDVFLFAVLTLDLNDKIITLIYYDTIVITFLRVYIINLIFISTISHPFIDRIKHFIIVSTVGEAQTFKNKCHFLVSECKFVDSVQSGKADVCPICQDTFLLTHLQACFWLITYTFIFKKKNN